MFIATNREIDRGDLRVTRTGKLGPATIDIGSDALGFYLMLDTPADCDALIAAAVEAKRLLDPPAPASPLTAGPCECAHGGVVHAGSAPYRCLHRGCGCERFRPPAPAGQGGVQFGPFDDAAVAE